MPSFPPSLPLHHPSSAQQQPLASSIDAEDDADDMNLGNGSPPRGGRNSGHPFKSLTPKRILAIAAALIFVVFFFGRSSGGGRDGYFRAGTAASTDKAPNEAAVKVDKLPPNSPQKQQSASSGKCTPPAGQKATTYALMIDAGSTGSRIHVYTFSHCDPDPNALPKLENEGFFMTKPGLSSYAGKPRDAAESLRGLMEHAIEGVPESERSCTPIAVKATAGLRLLGARQSQEILDEVERWLKEDWPFAVVKDGVVVMDGRDEGVYAWITINFVSPLVSTALHPC